MSAPVLGLRANWRQFLLLVILNAFVGAMVGLERTVLPLLAERDFGISSKAAILSFLVSFGLVKAFANLAAGGLSDRVGRKRILLIGWILGLPVAPMIIVAPSWGWVVAANVLLGLNQGLCWSMTVVMKIDLVGPARRGLAMGLNEFAGYLGVAASALATGYLAAAYASRSAPFLPGFVLAITGLLLSASLVRETTPHARVEAARATTGAAGDLRFRDVFRRVTWGDRSLFAASQAGLVNNLNDGMAWGLLPVFLFAAGLPVDRIGIVAAAYPASWGIAQILTGAASDRVGRKRMIAVGMWVQAGAILGFVLWSGFGAWLLAAVFLGLGTALVYPTLLAAVSDVAHPSWRASAVGVYRLWRDLGYAAGAVVAGLAADAFGVPAAFLLVGGLTFASGLVVILAMSETLPTVRT